MELFTLIPLLVMMAGASVSMCLAASRNRNPIAWALVGAAFPLIGALIIVLSKPLPDPRAPRPGFF